MGKGSIFLSKILDKERTKKYFLAHFRVDHCSKNPPKTHCLQAFSAIFKNPLFHVEQNAEPEMFHVKLMFFEQFFTLPKVFHVERPFFYKMSHFTYFLCCICLSDIVQKCISWVLYPIIILKTVLVASYGRKRGSD